MKEARQNEADLATGNNCPLQQGLDPNKVSGQITGPGFKI